MANLEYLKKDYNFAVNNLDFIMRKTRWLIYTVIIGLIPFIVRIVIYAFSINRTDGYMLNPVDFIFLGLTLNLTNLNELTSGRIDNITKIKFEGFSVIQVVILSGILFLLYFAEQSQQVLVDKTVALICAIFFCLVSFLFSYAIINKLNSLDDGNS